MNGKIDVVLVEPGKPAVMAEIGSDLDSLQRAVGGSIEAAYFYDDPIAIVCNEDGKNIGLPMNRAVKDENGEIMDIIVGKFFICGLGEDVGADFSLIVPPASSLTFSSPCVSRPSPWRIARRRGRCVRRASGPSSGHRVRHGRFHLPCSRSWRASGRRC